MADESRDVIAFIGDGSYLMMNSDIYSTVLTGHKLIVILCDNGGFAVINRLQNAKGVPSFNNQIEDCKIVNKVDVDFAAHAASMGALTPQRREPDRPRRRHPLGQDHRPHHRHRGEDRRLQLDAGRRLVGCRRAGSFATRAAVNEGAQGASRRAQEAAGGSVADMKARLGIAPIAWTNDDLPELGGDTPLEVCLSESREAGFSGTETGGKFPKTPRELQEVLAAHDLKLVSGWYSGRVLENDLSAEKDRAARAARAVPRERRAPSSSMARRPARCRTSATCRSPGGRASTTSRCAPMAASSPPSPSIATRSSVPLSFHHHMATAIETEDDVDRLMNFTGEAVGLLFDTGHITFAGGDALRMAQAPRQAHQPRPYEGHPQDRCCEASIRRRHSFLDAVLAGVFTVPGDGMIDFKAVAALCAEIGYEGWFVVEAEQDPKKANPLKYAKIGHEALTEALTEAGYTIEE